MRTRLTLSPSHFLPLGFQDQTQVISFGAKRPFHPLSHPIGFLFNFRKKVSLAWWDGSMGKCSMYKWPECESGNQPVVKRESAENCSLTSHACCHTHTYTVCTVDLDCSLNTLVLLFLLCLPLAPCLIQLQVCYQEISLASGIWWKSGAICRKMM